MLKNLALLVLSLFVFLGITEAALRLLGYSAIYDEYSKPTMLWQHDERLGWSHIPSSSETYIGPRPFPIEFRTPVQINSQGLRGPELPARPADGVRILVTGDSRAVAFEVPWEETFAARLEALLAARLAPRPVQVVNAGVRGYGTDQSYLYYHDLGRALDADFVIHMHSSNDVGDNVTLHRMRRPFGKAAYRLANAQLELIGVPVKPYPMCSEYRINRQFEIVRVDSLPQRIFCQLQIQLFDHSALFAFVGARIQRNPQLVEKLYGLGAPELADSARPGAGEGEGGEAEPPPAADEGARAHGIALTNALLRGYAEEVRADDARFLLLSWRQHLDRLDTGAVEAAGGQVTFLDDAFAGHERRSLSFVNDGHYNELGNRLIAEHLANVLAAQLAGGS